MRKAMLLVFALSFLGLIADGAWAKAIPISGTHSANEIKTACDKAGGEYNTLEGGGWGCTNNNCDGKGGKCSVGCDANGKCNGSTPAQTTPSKGVFDILKGTRGTTSGTTLAP